MGRFLRKSDYKVCPYCGVKNPTSAKNCINCKLDFSQLNELSNKQAKKMLIRKKFAETFEGEIVYVKDFPLDCSRKNAIIWCVFLGLFGAHNFYVGRFAKAFTSLILGSILFFGAGISGYLSLTAGIPYMQSIYTLSAIIGIAPIFMWLSDLVALIFNKYKVPAKLIKPVDIFAEEE